MMEIQISNLNQNTSDNTLRKLFSVYGEVESATVLRDRLNGRSRGTASVFMLNETAGANAILSLHHASVDGYIIRVSKVAYSTGHE